MPACKKSVYSIGSFLRYSQFFLEHRDQIGHTHFWPCPTQKFSLNSSFLWICIIMQKINLLYLFVLEKWLISKKISNLIAWEHFGLYLRNKIFPRHRICAATQQIISIFIIEQIQWKSITKLFSKFKKTYFWPISPIFQAKKVFPRNLAVTHNLIRQGFLPPCQNSEKPNDPILRKHPHRRQDRRMDRDTLFHRTIPATARSPTSTTAVDWHLKVKDIEYNVGPIKNYCITINMQKISSIHKLILKIQQILGSHELNGHAHFLPHPP